MFYRRHVLLLVSLVLLTMIAGITRATEYSVRFLDNSFTPNAINDLGQVSGVYRGPYHSGQHGVFWDPERGSMDIPFLPGESNVLVNGLNNSGQVVGGSLNYPFRPFVWQCNTGLKGLPITEQIHSSYALNINTSGDIVGWVEESGTAANMPCIWKADGTFVRLPTDIYSTGIACDINDLGQVVGYLGSASLGVLWNSDGSVVSLPPLPGRQWSAASYINSSGQVAGYSYGSDGYYLATVWQADGTPSWLGSFGGKYAHPTGMNDLGQVVGYDSGSGFVWSANEGLQRIYTPGGFAGTPQSINNLGQIVGLGYDQVSGQSRVCVWTPVPEPSSLCVLSLLVAALPVLRRKNKI